MRPWAGCSAPPGQDLWQVINTSEPQFCHLFNGDTLENQANEQMLSLLPKQASAPETGLPCLCWRAQPTVPAACHSVL